MRCLVFIFLLGFNFQLFAQDTIMQLWPKNKIPNQLVTSEKEIVKHDDILRISNVQIPTIEVYLPTKANSLRKAMLIFPGGGYGMLAYDWEGTDIAKLLNGKGIVGIVVKYRLPSSKSQSNKHFVPLIDAQRAIRVVRANSEEFNIDANKIGIIGFSAGGHLAATLGTHFNEKVYEEIDDVDKESARPDFMALGYPVITFGKKTHQGSKKNLIGETPNQELVAYFSNEKRVNKNTPATFLFHATDDKAVPVENSLLFYKALKNQEVSATMHIYPKGGHGFSLALSDKHLKGWTERMFEWINTL